MRFTSQTAGTKRQGRESQKDERNLAVASRAAHHVSHPVIVLLIIMFRV